jgi:hypothetical protein
MYSDFNNAFNDNTKEIDKMARDIHVKKNNLFNSVYNDYNNQKLKWDQDITEYNSGKIHPNNLKDTVDFPDSISIDSISIDSPELDSIIDSGKFIQNPISKYVKNNNNCKKIKQGDDVFLHIKNCFDCRDKLIKYLKKNNKSTNNKSINNKSTNNKSTIKKIKDVYSEIFIIIIIGIVIIFILDFLMKSLVQNSIR